MSNKIVHTGLLLLLGCLLVACGGTAQQTPVATFEPTATTSAALPAETPAGGQPEPTGESATPETTPVVSSLCPDVSLPALVLATGSGFDLHNPLDGARCTLPLPGGDVSSLSIGGDRLYFMLRDFDAATSTAARLAEDGVVEPLTITEATGDTHYLSQFAVAADGTRLAWSHTRPAGGDDPMALVSSLWLGAVEASSPVTVFADTAMGQNRVATPVRFSADGQTLFFTWQPMGLGGSWNAFNGRYDNLYRVPVAGGEPQKVYDCADHALFLCIGDFRDDGTLAYIDTGRTVHVNGPDGAEMASHATTSDYAGYPTFGPDGDLFFSTAVLASDETDSLVPSPGTFYRVPAPYAAEPEVIVNDVGVLPAAFPQPFLDAGHVVIGYVEGEQWGSGLLVTETGEIMPLEPWPNASLAVVWP